MVRRRLAAVAALAALALCAPATARADDCAGADVVPAADNVAVVGQATLCLLNQQRAANGVGPLVENAALSTASAGYSQRMVAQGFFGHESPDGGTLVSASRPSATSAATTPGSSGRTSAGARPRWPRRARWSPRG